MSIILSRLIKNAQRSNLISGNLFDVATINYFQTYILDFLEKGISFIYFEKVNKTFDIFMLKWDDVKDVFYQKKKFGCCYYLVFNDENITKDVYFRFTWFSKKRKIIHSRIYDLLNKNLIIKILKEKEKMTDFML